MYIYSFESCNIRYIMPYKLQNSILTRNAVGYSPFTLAYQQNAYIYDV